MRIRVAITEIPREPIEIFHRADGLVDVTMGEALTITLLPGSAEELASKLLGLSISNKETVNEEVGSVPSVVAVDPGVLDHFEG